MYLNQKNECIEFVQKKEQKQNNEKTMTVKSSSFESKKKHKNVNLNIRVYKKKSVCSKIMDKWHQCIYAVCVYQINNTICLWFNNEMFFYDNDDDDVCGNFLSHRNN